MEASRSLPGALARDSRSSDAVEASRSLRASGGVQTSGVTRSLPVRVAKYIIRFIIVNTTNNTFNKE